MTKKIEVAHLMFCTSPAVTLCFSVCAPSHLAPGAFLGPTGRGVRWFLGSFLLGISHGMHPFLLSGLSWDLFTTMSKPDCAVCTISSLFNLACRHSLDCSMKTVHTNLLFLFALHLVQKLFIWFWSPCSTQYNVRGLKTM